MQRLRHVGTAAGLWLAGCGSPAPLPVASSFDGPAVDGTDSSNDTSGTHPSSDFGHWSLSSPQACAAPLPEARWTESSARFGERDAPSAPHPEGSLALVQTDDGFAAWTLEANEAGWLALRWALDMPVSEVPTPIPTRRLMVVDLDRNDTPELVALTTGLCIGWDGDLADCDAHPLSEMVGVRDIRVVDIDGDAQPELLTVVSPVDHGEAAGFIERRSLDGALLETVQPEAMGPRVPFFFDVRDYDGDGHADLYLCTDMGASFGGNQLWRGDGSGGWALAEGTGLEVVGDCMGLSAGDLDREGKLDLFVTGTGHDWLLERDDGGWADGAVARGIPTMEPTEMAWGGALVDLDNDGRTDLLAASASLSELGATSWPWRALQQQADGRFEAWPAGLDLPEAAGVRAILARDLNGDGVLDLLGSDFQRGVPWLFLSDGCTVDHWLAVDAPEGSLVVVDAGGVQRAAQVTGMPGYGASAAPLAWVGLGTTATVDAVVLTAPGQSPVRLEGPLAARRTVRWRPEADTEGFW